MLVGRHANVYEVVSEALEPLWRMTPDGDGWPLLLDRRAKLVPAVDGYPLPDFYHWLMLPFSERKVRALCPRSPSDSVLVVDQTESRCLAVCCPTPGPGTSCPCSVVPSATHTAGFQGAAERSQLLLATGSCQGQAAHSRFCWDKAACLRIVGVWDKMFPLLQVEDLHELSARRHARAASRSRCFRRVLMCSVQNMISPPRGMSNVDFRWEAGRDEALVHPAMQFWSATADTVSVPVLRIQ